MDLLHKLPIRKKLTLIIFISNVVLLTLVFAVSMYWDNHVLKRTTVDYANSQIQVLSQDFTKILLIDSPHQAADAVSRLEVTTSIDNAFLYDRVGNVLFRYTRTPSLSMKPPQLHTAEHYFEGGYLHIFAPVVYEGTRYGTVYFRLANDLFTSKLRDDWHAAILFFVGVIALSFVIAYLFQRFFSGPVIELGRLLDKVAVEHDFNVRAVTRERNEIGDMYANFNRMIEEIKSYHTELSEKNRELELHRHHLKELVDEQTRELQLYTRELEAFSYSVSHDLRSPLRAIHGFSQIILEDHLQRLGDDEAKSCFRRICNASTRMSELIDDLLQLSRYTQHDINIEAVDFSELCQGVVSVMETTHHNNIPDIRVMSGLQLYGDAKLLRIVMENLLGNAIKYTQYQPSPNVEVGWCHSDSGSTVYVKDNGVGFDAQFANKLFLPFERLHDANRYEGTGIGLAIVQRIISRHGGRVWAEGREDEGATFYFTLPGQAEQVPALQGGMLV